MSQIEINCIGSDAVFTNTPNIFSGGNVDTVKFTFNSEWDSYTNKTAVFYLNPKDTYLQILDSNNVATIPAEMIAKKSKLSIGVIGTNADGDIKTSKILTYLVGQGAITDDMEVNPPTPDVWLQTLSIVKQNKDIVDYCKQMVDNMQLTVDESQLPNKANKDLSNVTVDAIQNKGIARVVTGSYTGTGTYGSDEPNSLGFTAKPQVVFIMTCNTSRDKSIYFIRPHNYGYNDGSTGASDVKIHATWLNNLLSWYSGSVNDQMNVSGTEYFYFAIL